MSQQKTVLVTGCSSGFGRLMVETLARHGHTTVAGMRDPAGKNASASAELRALAEREHLPLHIVALDVTDDASVQEAVHTAAEKSGGRIDVLVNNAGIASFGITEAFTIEQVARQFDTNVFGPLRMKRAESGRRPDRGNEHEPGADSDAVHGDLLRDQGGRRDVR
jgi:NAD(P)-dependent dehydrogenase (short-subunit alcohol dehydrogenase family)